MEIKFNTTGPDRKRMVNTIAEALEAKPTYLGAPSMAYRIGDYTVDRNGTLIFDDQNDSEEVERVLETLLDAGFECDPWERKEPKPAETTESKADGLTITIPLNGLDPSACDRLMKLVDSKAALIKKALNAARLDIKPEWDADRISFPWFDRIPSFDEIQAYSAFINALCKMAKESIRVTAKEKEVESEKYAFRGFLLRLGFVGSDSKEERKTLLKNLSGSAAFPNKAAAEAFSAAQKAKRAAEKEVQ